MSPFWGHNALQDMLCHLIHVTSSHDIVSAIILHHINVMQSVSLFVCVCLFVCVSCVSAVSGPVCNARYTLNGTL